jgi:UDP-N-acetylmuramate--alanine ligase
MNEFATKKIWKDSDELIVTDIYSAGEEKIEGVTIEAFLEKLEKKATYVPREKIVHFLQNRISSGDLVVTLGAGDITTVSSELIV